MHTQQLNNGQGDAAQRNEVCVEEEKHEDRDDKDEDRDDKEEVEMIRKRQRKMKNLKIVDDFTRVWKNEIEKTE